MGGASAPRPPTCSRALYEGVHENGGPGLSVRVVERHPVRRRSLLVKIPQRTSISIRTNFQIPTWGASMLIPDAKLRARDGRDATPRHIL